LGSTKKGEKKRSKSPCPRSEVGKGTRAVRQKQEDAFRGRGEGVEGLRGTIFLMMGRGEEERERGGVNNIMGGFLLFSLNKGK